MSESDQNPDLLCRCHPTPCTLGEFLAKTHAFLTDLMPLHPLFSTLHLVGKSDEDSPLLATNFSNLEPWLFERSWDRKTPTGSRYEALGPDARPTSKSRGNLGFNASLSNLQGWDNKLEISILDGNRLMGTCNLTFPGKGHHEFKKLPLARQLLSIVIKHWPVHFASLSTGAWHSAVNWLGSQSDWRNNMEIGWLTYLDDPSIAKVMPAAIKCEPLGPGVVFQLSDHFSTHENPDDVTLGLRVKQALADAGRLSVRPSR